MRESLGTDDLREEPMPADVEAKALVAGGPRQAADDIVGFEDGDPCFALFAQLVGRRQAGRTRPDDDDAIPG
jgi:hypothetical protein